MDQPELAVKPNGQERSPFVPVEAVDSEAARPAGAIRFVHACGSKPLAGYTIKRGVGAGGFGEIYYAVSDAGKEVALKLIRQHLEVELRGIRQCLNLKHPNLVALYDIRQDEHDATWVVMEYVTGQSLEELLAAHPQGLPVPQVLAWFHGIAAGVAHLHDHGIVHRDLKPGNLFADAGLVKVGDYGLSKFISCSRRSGQTESIGTVHYMAPEVANGRYGKEIDIYALGIILYEMLTGRVPFEGESVGEVLMKHLTAEADVSMLAEPFRSVVAKALRKDPARRFRSVGEMLAGLPAPPLATAGDPALYPGAFRAVHIPASSVQPVSVRPEEPILHSVRQFIYQQRRAWSEARGTPQTRTVLLVVGVLALAMTSSAWLPLVLPLLLVYLFYRMIRELVLLVSSGRSGPAGQPVAPLGAGVSLVVPPADPRPRPVAAWERAAPALVLQPAGQRMAQWLGSLLVAAAVVLVVCLVMMLVEGYHSPLPRPEEIAWLLVVSTLGAWTVLTASAFWEGTRGDATLRRFVMMVLGLGLGLAAYGVAYGLTVGLPLESSFLAADASFPRQWSEHWPSRFYAVDGTPRLLAYLAAFGTLFLLIRWWRQADVLRPVRFSLWSTAVCGLVAAVVASAWDFPQPWLVMTATAISAAVQLASPWWATHDRRRRAMREVRS